MHCSACENRAENPSGFVQLQRVWNRDVAQNLSSGCAAAARFAAALCRLLNHSYFAANTQQLSKARDF